MSGLIVASYWVFMLYSMHPTVYVTTALGVKFTTQEECREVGLANQKKNNIPEMPDRITYENANKLPDMGWKCKEIQ